MSANWKMDAREFGRFVKKGGWYVAYLAARCVKEGNGQGSRSDLGKALPKSEVCSATEFATEAGLSHPTVTAYLRTWDRAAEQGIVPPRSTFVGKEGINVPLPDDEVEAWSDWHSATANAGRHVQDPTRREALIAQANADGVGASKVLDVASNKRAVIAAVKADPSLAAAIAADDEAALAVHREENLRRTADATPRRKAEVGGREPLSLTESLILIGANADVRTVLDRVTAAAHEGRGFTPEMRDAMVMAADEGIALYTSLRGVLTGEIDASLSDADINALLGGQA